MTKLVEHFNTCYFPSHFSSNVGALVRKEKGTDIAGAHICRDVMEVLICLSYQGAAIVDSEDSERNGYFMENHRRGRNTAEIAATGTTFSTLRLPKSVAEVPELITKLETGKVYGTDLNQVKLQLAYIFLVQAARPDITIDLGATVPQLFLTIYRNLLPSPHRWENFYVLTGNTFIETQAPKEGYDTFISTNVCVPTDFGRICLFKEPAWAPCIKRITRHLELQLQSKRKSLTDYI